MFWIEVALDVIIAVVAIGFILLLSLCIFDFIDETIHERDRFVPDHTWCAEAYIDVECVRIVPAPPYDWEDEGVNVER